MKTHAIYYISMGAASSILLSRWKMLDRLGELRIIGSHKKMASFTFGRQICKKKTNKCQKYANRMAACYFLWIAERLYNVHWIELNQVVPRYWYNAAELFYRMLKNSKIIVWPNPISDVDAHFMFRSFWSWFTSNIPSIHWCTVHTALTYAQYIRTSNASNPWTLNVDSSSHKNRHSSEKQWIAS